MGMAANYRRSLTIGLINNMPDQAVKATERQFEALLSAAAGTVDVRLRLFALGRVARSQAALDYMRPKYEPARMLVAGGVDCLIVTGAQPSAAHVRNEPFWEELAEVIDWAKENTLSAIFSCLAAHAAVLHLDRIERRRLSGKLVGVFPFASQGGHPLVGARGTNRLVPHSRYNDLSAEDLELAGYKILSESPAHGVDAFTKSFVSQFLFLQGHPEYDADSLAREYRRDLRRFVLREITDLPVMPRAYFPSAAENELRRMQEHAAPGADRLSLEAVDRLEILAPKRRSWRSAAVALYRSWIDAIATRARSRRNAEEAKTDSLAPLPVA
jgi:homoserine O-succinyltransferase/O-acetyltransferase